MYRHVTLRKLGQWSVLPFLMLLGPAGASDLEERMERLEAQMERLIRHLEEQRAPESAAAPESPPAVSQPEPAMAPSPPVTSAEPGSDPVARPGEVRVRYYIGSNPLGREPPRTEPMADGLFTLDGDLRLDPFHYGAAERRLLGGSYRDPSVHRAVGIMLDGWMDIPRSGVHRLEVTPKPARERGESSASNTMIILMWIDGERVLDLEGVQSWRRQRVERTLSAGRHPFRLWVVSNSPGFGVPAIDSRLGMEVVMPGRAELTPLWRQMSPP